MLVSLDLLPRGRVTGFDIQSVVLTPRVHESVLHDSHPT